jgi:hypothetical protein
MMDKYLPSLTEEETGVEGNTMMLTKSDKK